LHIVPVVTVKLQMRVQNTCSKHFQLTAVIDGVWVPSLITITCDEKR